MRVLYILIFLFNFCFQGSISAQTTFSGFGSIVIGAEFKALPNVDDFKKYRKDLYYVDRVRLSDEVGLVDKLYVYLYEGKIYKVSFTAEEFTNNSAILQVLSKLEEMTKPNVRIAQQFQLFYTKDQTIGFTKYLQPDKSILYSYFDKRINSEQIEIEKSR